jgi:hypothetical protein
MENQKMGNRFCFAVDDAFPVQLPIQNHWELGELVVALDSRSIKFHYSEQVGAFTGPVCSENISQMTSG